MGESLTLGGPQPKPRGTTDRQTSMSQQGMSMTPILDQKQEKFGLEVSDGLIFREEILGLIKSVSITVGIAVRGP